MPKQPHKELELMARFEREVRRDGRYALEAFEFLQAGLAHATSERYGDELTEGRGRHVTGQELCHALRDVALERWGPLARLVLSRWGIRATRDFGEMVYLMIGLGLMGRQDSDDINDFDHVYRFEEAFDKARYRVADASDE